MKHLMIHKRTTTLSKRQGCCRENIKRGEEEQQQ